MDSEIFGWSPRVMNGCKMTSFAICNLSVSYKNSLISKRDDTHYRRSVMREDRSIRGSHQPQKFQFCPPAFGTYSTLDLHPNPLWLLTLTGGFLETMCCRDICDQFGLTRRSILKKLQLLLFVLQYLVN